MCIKCKGADEVLGGTDVAGKGRRANTLCKAGT